MLNDTRLVATPLCVKACKGKGNCQFSLGRLRRLAHGRPHTEHSNLRMAHQLTISRLLFQKKVG
ncbi:MAG: hypothetical protein EAY75_16230 [Bacteroidetes bacterium]|nr:MAG: hypothetical protein EAY75_16230 [Bacteroidota bacterium]